MTVLLSRFSRLVMLLSRDSAYQVRSAVTVAPVTRTISAVESAPVSEVDRLCELRGIHDLDAMPAQIREVPDVVRHHHRHAGHARDLGDVGVVDPSTDETVPEPYLRACALPW